MRRTILVVTLLVLAAGMTPGAVAQSGEAYSGTHVSFETESNAITGYTVNGDAVFESVSVGNADESDLGIGADVSASAITSIEATGLSIASQTAASVTVSAESGAELRSHDNDRGHLIVEAGDEDQHVIAELDGEASAESEGDRVIVDTEQGTTATAIVVGDGEVAVNDDGDLSAELQSGAELVFRSNGEERSDDDREQESMIESGQATAELHVMDRDGERVDDTVAYGQETSATASQEAESTIEVIVDRTTDEGTVLLTTVSESVIENANDIQVHVDGEAAVQASSYSELESAAAGNDGSMYLVTESSAEASADVLVAIDHFSDRTVTIDASDDDESADDEETTDDGSVDDQEADDGTTGDSAPGFGVGVALTALLSLSALVGRRQ